MVNKLFIYSLTIGYETIIGQTHQTHVLMSFDQINSINQCDSCQLIYNMASCVAIYLNAYNASKIIY